MKFTGNNSSEYWDLSWKRNVKKFPKYTMNRVFGLIPKDVSVLDIGSGNGKFLLRLKEDKNCTVFGIDISSVAIEKGRKVGVDGMVASAEELGEFNAEFDVVVCCHLLEHIGDDNGLMWNISRLAKKFAIIAVPNDCSYPEETGEHVRKYTRESLKQLISKYFVKTEDYTLGNHLIFKCLK